MAARYHYPGEELELFAEAGAWKQYFSGKIISYIKGEVLEAGAGMGETTVFMLNEHVKTWTCLEPDEQLASIIGSKIHSCILPADCRVIKGNISDLAPEKMFDTILYIDVLEHIPDDNTEWQQALKHLNDDGHLVILSPALPFLYSRFDRAIGHERRYTRKSLRKLASTGEGLEEKELFYLESAGAFLLFLNKYLTRKKYPTRKDIRIWQRIFLPISKLVDKILFYHFGKTIIGIWQKREKKI
jgi:2-polyprenyl-3-methyl-5-hydroxy-6-metoxy-1,4-benzoquinol methylase